MGFHAQLIMIKTGIVNWKSWPEQKKDNSGGSPPKEMKIKSWNIRGLAGAGRRLLVKDCLHRNKVHIALLQE